MRQKYLILVPLSLLVRFIFSPIVKDTLVNMHKEFKHFIISAAVFLSLEVHSVLKTNLKNPFKLYSFVKWLKNIFHQRNKI